MKQSRLLVGILVGAAILLAGLGIGYYLFSPETPGTLGYKVANTEAGSQITLKGEVSLSMKVPFTDKEGFLLRGLEDDKTQVMVTYHGDLPSEGTVVRVIGKVIEVHGFRYVEGELVLPF